MSAKISKLADVDPRAQIGANVEVGPFCVVGPHVTLGAGSRLDNNVTITGHVTLGANNRMLPGVVIGAEPQDVSYRGTDTRVVIGDNNLFRECVTINRASEKEDGITSIGSNCYFMAGVHVAHDCRVGSNIIIANGSMLGGHVHIHDCATLSGAVAVHHFVSIGSFSFVGGLSRVLHDVPPYMLVEGIPTQPRCVNVIALKRRHFSAEAIRALVEAHRLLYRSRVGLDNAREILSARGPLSPEVVHLFEFLSYQRGGQHGRGRDRRKAAA